MAIIKLTNQNANIITAGTFADARLSASSVTQHAQSVDLQPVKSDITALALREATNESSASFNLPNQHIDTFATDTLGTKTDASLITGGAVATVYSAVQEFQNDSNTVLLFHANNNTTDSSSNGITLTSSSTSFSSSEKKFGTHSFSLNGNSNNLLYTGDLDTVDNSVTTPTTGVYTLEMWFKYNGRSGTDRIFSLGNRGATGTSYGSGSTPFASGGFNDNFFNVYGDYGNDYNWDVSGTATGSYYNTSNWHHVALTRISNGDTLFHFDGTYKASNNQWNGDNIQAHYGDLILGQRSGSSTEGFNGYIDEVRYSNTDRYSSSNFTPNLVTLTSATGTIIQNTNTVGSAKTKVGGTMLYKDNQSTATPGTDLKVYINGNC